MYMNDGASFRNFRCSDLDPGLLVTTNTFNQKLNIATSLFFAMKPGWDHFGVIENQ